MKFFQKMGKLCVTIFLLHATSFAQKSSGHSIEITVKPYQNKWIYIGEYYGKFRNVIDSVHLNAESKGAFTGKKTLPEGIYFIVSPEKKILKEFLIDKQQQFAISMDTLDIKSTKFAHSKVNDDYDTYQKYIASLAPTLDQDYKQLHGTTAADSMVARKDITLQMDKLQNFRDNYIQKNSQSLLSTFFLAMKNPPFKIENKDTLAAFQKAKDAYWDHIDFSDSALLRTPFLDPKVMQYFQQYVSADPDSIIPAINYILLLSRSSDEMHKYWLGRFTDEYINPKIMGQDKVFLFLFNNYYSKGDTSWLNPEQKKYIFDRGYSIMANQLGEQAPQLNLKDVNGISHDIQKMTSKFTVVLFWDPECSHCKIIVPKMETLYQNKWKKEGVDIYAVNTAEDNKPKWMQFIKDNHLNDWINVMQSKAEMDDDVKMQRPNYRQLYDVYETPTLYLLDKEKKIIAKKLSYEQLDKLIDFKLNQEK